MHGNNGHAFYIRHYFGLESTRHSKTLYKWGVLLVNDAIVSHPFSRPNAPLQVETTSKYFAGIFNLYIGTISILFRPIMHVVWLLQHKLIIACKTGHFVSVERFNL